MNKSFLRLLVVVSLMALGLLYLLSATFNYMSGVEATTQILLIATIGVGLVASSYAMFYGKRIGWILALIFTTFDATVNIYYNVYVALVVDAILIFLLILVANEFGISIYAKKPMTPVPPPSKPLSTAFMQVIDNEMRFVRRKRRGM